MEYTVSGRAKKVNALFFGMLFNLLAFKVYYLFLSKKSKEKKLEKIHKKSAAKMAGIFMELEGLFLKLAQQISTMSSMLPKSYTKAFEGAQDHSVPRPYAHIKKRIELELGDKIENLFSAFNETPIGVASIGQVHRATLKTGEQVAVKVQHLKIDEIAKLDLQLIEKLLRTLQYFIKIPGFDSVFEEVVKMIHEELDYVHEAEQIKLISENVKKDDRILIPKVYSQYSTKKVLVMDYMKGAKITNLDFLRDNKIDQQLLVKNLLDIFSKNIFIDGIFHADPHPGNILVNEKGQLILLDFGAVGTFESHMKEGLIILMQATILKDENLMIEGFKKMGFIGDDPGIDKMCKKIIRILSDFLVNEIQIDSINITQVNIDDIDISKVLDLIKGLDIKEIEEVVKIPKDWVLLNRTIVLIMGITTELAPETEIYKEVKPNILKMAIQKDNVGMLLKTTIKQQALRVISLPRKIELFLAQAENGEIEINVKKRKFEIKLIYALVQQVLFLIAAILCYSMYTDSGNEVMKWTSLGSAALFIRSFALGLHYKRKLR